MPARPQRLDRDGSELLSHDSATGEQPFRKAVIGTNVGVDDYRIIGDKRSFERATVCVSSAAGGGVRLLDPPRGP